MILNQNRLNIRHQWLIAVVFWTWSWARFIKLAWIHWSRDSVDSRFTFEIQIHIVLQYHLTKLTMAQLNSDNQVKSISDMQKDEISMDCHMKRNTTKRTTTNKITLKTRIWVVLLIWNLQTNTILMYSVLTFFNYNIMKQD